MRGRGRGAPRGRGGLSRGRGGRTGDRDDFQTPQGKAAGGCMIQAQ